MRRYISYLIVASVAFVLSVFAVHQYNNREIAVFSETNSISKQIFANDEQKRTGSITVASDSSRDENKQIDTQKKYVVCRDKTISLVWKQLQNSVKNFWDNVNSTMDIYDCAQMFEAGKFDLNNDGINEIRIRGQFGNFCGATGNCSEWIFGKTEKFGKYKLLLNSGGEYFYVKRNLTNGYRDIYITTHSSAYSSHHMVYKFSGNRYIENKCWFEEYLTTGEKQVMSCAEELRLSEQELRASQARRKENK